MRKTKTDAILVDCSTCGEALKTVYPGFFHKKDPWAADAAQISNKVVDMLTFIENRLDLLRFRPDMMNNKRSVIYHAPCHSKNSGFGHAENLIKKLPFIDYRKTIDVEECCGGGGTFFYEYPDISKKMIDKKIENARAAQADLWLTDCPVCRMNLAGNLTQKDQLEVIHPLTLINSALDSDEHYA